MYGFSFGALAFDLKCTGWPQSLKMHFSLKTMRDRDYICIRDIYRKSYIGFQLVLRPLTSNAPDRWPLSVSYARDFICIRDMYIGHQAMLLGLQGRLCICSQIHIFLVYFWIWTFNPNFIKVCITVKSQMCNTNWPKMMHKFA